MSTNNCSTQIRTASGINVALGAVLATAPYFLHYTPLQVGLTYDNLIVGGAITICAGVRFVRPRSSSAFGVTNMLLGFWTLISSSLFGDDIATSGWLQLGVGATVMILAAWGVNLIVGPPHGRHA
jgi:hypothetical protein